LYFFFFFFFFFFLVFFLFFFFFVFFFFVFFFFFFFFCRSHVITMHQHLCPSQTTADSPCPLEIISITVAILAQGTSWADAATQAFFHGFESFRTNARGHGIRSEITLWNSSGNIRMAAAQDEKQIIVFARHPRALLEATCFASKPRF
jgi:hypothetical protein